jgi:hypothetical protein
VEAKCMSLKTLFGKNPTSSAFDTVSTEIMTGARLRISRDRTQPSWHLERRSKDHYVLSAMLASIGGWS